MSDWTAGYRADIGYTYGYYSGLNPLQVKLAFLHNGLVFPECGTACELGFGQGVSVNMHAAASITQWYGTDFNPAHAGFAQALANAGGSGARLYDESFCDFANRTDLPAFDYIGLHGIWSWISDENRLVIVDFIRRKLKVGGVLYISYNALPGWGALSSIRHLMSEHADVLSSNRQGITSRVDAAIDFFEQLLKTNPLFSRANPQIAALFEKIKTENCGYLAHEYFNQHWHPMHFATIAEWLEPAKLQFACSAHYLDLVDVIHLTADQMTFLKTIADPILRESTRDFMVNQLFRRDYWVKGLRTLNYHEQFEQLNALRVMLVTHRADVELKARGAISDVRLNDAVYVPILDVLADHLPKTLSQIKHAVEDKGVGFAEVLQASLVLSGLGHLVAVQDDEVIGKTQLHCQRLNHHILNLAKGSHDVGFIASPVTGGGVHLGRFQQLFLLALSEGMAQPADWAQFVWGLLRVQEHKLVKDGVVLESVDQNIAELTAQANRFAQKQLPVLKALQIV